MFGRRYFGGRYFAPRYFGDGPEAVEFALPISAAVVISADQRATLALSAAGSITVTTRAAG